MQDLNSLIERYLSACLYHKGLNSKTIKAYRIDLHQFSRQASRLWYSKEQVIDYLALLRQKYTGNEGVRSLAEDEGPRITCDIETYFNGDNSIAADELRVKELVGRITQMAAQESYAEEMEELIAELNATKSRITLRRTIQQSTASARNRLSEVLEALEEVRNQSIRYPP